MQLILTLLVVIPIVSTEVTISGYKIFEKIWNQCANGDDLFKCLKIQTIMMSERAVRFKSLNLFSGVSLVSISRQPRNMRFGLNVNESKLEKLDNEELDGLLGDSTGSFLRNYQLEVKLPDLIEEGRRKKNRRGGGNAALYWALAIKGTFLAVAYKGIAIMSGLALIMGKMALLLTAILGLKKLVNNGQETTTVEIIKQPKYSESHTHSTSYEDDEKYHHRSYDTGETKSSKTILKTLL